MSDQNDIGKLEHLIKDIKVAMMTTADEEGRLHSRPMASLHAPFDGDLWFFTSSSSHKVLEMKRDARVSLSYANPGRDVYVSVTATLLLDSKKVKSLWDPSMKTWFPRGVEDPELALLKVHVERAEYWDSAGGAAGSLAIFAKAMAAGHQGKR